MLAGRAARLEFVMKSSEVISFGSFRLVPGRRELLVNDAAVPLGSRAFDLLVALVRRDGRLATKNELMDEVWPGTVVEENNLAAQVSALRKVLALDPDVARCLRTVPGRGYRFVASLQADETAGDAMNSEPLSIVVLPFTNLSGDPEQAFFAQGMSETVTTGLSRVSGVLVISATAAATFQDKVVDVRQISRELSVRFVLTGSVQCSPSTVRINAQLLEGHSGAQLWSETFDGDNRDIFGLQDRITGRIAISIGREIFIAAARDGKARNIDPKAADLIMRGIAVDNRPQTLEVLREQERLFAQALKLEPHNADALARLARAILLQSAQSHAPAPFKHEALERGGEAAEKAVELDPNNARAHLAMSYLHVLRRDFERCIASAERAIALDCNLAMAHNMLATSHIHLGRGYDGYVAARAALRLDPVGPQFDVFSTSFSRARAANPRLARAHAGAAIALAARGDLAAAHLAAADLVRSAPSYRLSESIDASLPSSTPSYRQFYEEVLRPGAERAGVPV
jgi:TolB-like protein